MAVIFKKADNEIVQVMQAAMDKHHPDLGAAGFRVSVREAVNEDSERPAIKVHGHAAAVRIKRVATKDYILMACDAIIDVDLRVWEHLDDAQRLALMDHELSHVGLKLDYDEQVKTDDNDRPKWVMIPHDYDLSGFVHIIKRHKKAAVEVLAIRVAVERCKEQLLFAFDQAKTLPA
jgi:hypothetical protein